MASNEARNKKPSFVLTADALNQALPLMGMSTRAIHADDFHSPHRAIAPGMHVAVNYRYARNPDDLVPMKNEDVRTPGLQIFDTLLLPAN
jgi:hypothetical protein